MPPRRRLLVGLDLRFARNVHQTSTEDPGLIEVLQVEWYSRSLTSNGRAEREAGCHLGEGWTRKEHINMSAFVITDVEITDASLLDSFLSE